MTTSWVDSSPELFKSLGPRENAQRIINFLAEVVVNGSTTPLGIGAPPREEEPLLPTFLSPSELTSTPPPGWRDVLLKVLLFFFLAFEFHH